MKHASTPSVNEIDSLGHYFSGQLSLATTDLPHDISERLRVARLLAIGQRKPLVQVRQAQTNHVHANGTLASSGDEGLGLWGILASSLPLLALVIGLLAIQWTKEDNIAMEIAATDSALLTDELPPHAYTDAGFAQFLKLNRSTTGQHD
jgi:hypothetical protein